MYGETARSSALAPAVTGLSPRVRGNRWRAGRGVWRGRSIPACTGKPATPSMAAQHSRVYPRVYGETDAGALVIVGPGGLSPRVRGNQSHCHSGLWSQGSIPACTGKPVVELEYLEEDRVYPRVYGETQHLSLAWTHDHGLSPRVRGNPESFADDLAFRGSIPACTGKP